MFLLRLAIAVIGLTVFALPTRAQAECGNGVIESGEQCDDGNLVSGDGCSATCQFEGCPLTGTWLGSPMGPYTAAIVEDGAGMLGGVTFPVGSWGAPLAISGSRTGASFVLTAGPFTFSGAMDSCDSYLLTGIVTFTSTRQRSTYCGDGVVQSPEEACDDGDLSNGGTCTVACTLPVCGNGIVEGSEVCDDGNTVDGDGCGSNCTLQFCGDGVLGPGEECDDGNDIDGDGCDVNCRPTGCGNGNVTAGEECDDGNTVGGDGCRADCTLELCGDGIVDPQEVCDDGNQIDGDGCDVTCRPTGCGNGHVTAGEECDDGNTVESDCCHNDCTLDPAGTSCVPPVPSFPGQCDPAGHCVGIPTLSEWGVALLSLLMLAAVLHDRRRIAVGGR